MAEFNSYLLGKAKKSVGNITLCYTKRKNIARAKVFSRKDNPTPEILVQRAKMGLLVRVVRAFLPVIRKSFVGVGKGSTSNAFVACNMKAVTVDDRYAATIDFARLSVASGILNPPKVTVAYNEEEGSFQFMQEVQPEEDGFAFFDDRVYGVLYETGRNRSRLVELKNRGESGVTPYFLPDEWDASKVEVYAFVLQKNGRAASDSVHLAV
ncbi:MAG: hypothetical protein K2O69_05970 [Odoribacter sp.]|nr:hypothetical protein [Odoribacter sp.]